MSEKKGFGSMLKLGVILAVYAAAACVGLAFVYAGTKDKIAEQQAAELEAALNELFPGAEFESITDISSADPAVTIEGDKNNPANTGAFAAMKGGKAIGVALRTSRASYNGPIKLLVGVGSDGRISGVKVMEHTDTPGLGANAASETYYVDRSNGIHFYDQFTGKTASDPFEVKQDVIIITAATITSRAVAESVNAAGEAAAAWFASGANGGSR